MKRVALFLLLLLFLFAAGAAVLAAYSWQWLNQPIDRNKTLPAELHLVVEKGRTLSSVAYELDTEGALDYPRVWLAYAKYKQLANKIHAGRYSVDTNQTPIALLEQLVDGAVDFKKLTIVEGSRYSDVLEKFRASPYVTVAAIPLSNEQLARELNLAEGAVLEGWFYPDTLVFAEGTQALTLLKQGKDKMLNVLNEEWAAREDNLPYESAYEALIMASIVEKETGRASERKQIAGVFVRRLRKGMRLQTDPTVIYGMGDRYKGNIRRSDLRADTPYNTYTRFGLPPSPIALPGREAIHAALHPAKGDALFFVAKGDGSHYFSATLDEHEKAVTKYQRSRRKDYRSSP